MTLAAFWKRRVPPPRLQCWLITHLAFSKNTYVDYENCREPGGVFVCQPACAAWDTFIGKLPKNSEARNWMYDGYEFHLFRAKNTIAQVTCDECRALYEEHSHNVRLDFDGRPLYKDSELDHQGINTICPKCNNPGIRWFVGDQPKHIRYAQCRDCKYHFAVDVK